MFIYQDGDAFGKVREGKGKQPSLQPMSEGSGVSRAAAETPQPEGKPLSCHSTGTWGAGADTGEDLLPKAAATTTATRSKTYSAIKVHFGKTETSTGGH